jgi:3D (Asp-Asp-Asp) domain-containing protein
MRKWMNCAILVAAILLFPMSSYAESELTELTPYIDIKVQLHNQLIDFPDAAPYKDEQHRIQVPVRFVSEQLGFQIEWEKTESDYRITLKNELHTIHMQTGSQEMIHNEVTAELDTAPAYIDQRIYVPLRFLVELSGLSISWDNPNQVAIIHEPDAVVASVWKAPQWKVLEDVKAYAYTTEPDKNGGFKGRDYSGYRVGLGTVAVDPDVIPLGSTLYIEGYDYDGLPEGGMIARATDIGGSIKGKIIDIFIPDIRSKVIKFGTQTVKVYILQEE